MTFLIRCRIILLLGCLFLSMPSISRATEVQTTSFVGSGDQSTDSMAVSTDGRFMMTLSGNEALAWDMATKKLIQQVNMEDYDRRYLGQHGHIGTLELEGEAKRDIDADEYHIDLFLPGSPKATRIATHVLAGNIEYCVLSPTGKQLAYQSRIWSDKIETMTVIDVASGKTLSRFPCPDDLRAFNWSVDERTMILGDEADLLVYSLDNDVTEELALPLQRSSLQSSIITRICVTESAEIIVGHDDEKLRVYSFQDRKLALRSTIELGVRTDDLSWHPEHGIAAVYSSYGNGNSLSLIDIDTGDILLSPQGIRARQVCAVSSGLDFIVDVEGTLRPYSLTCFLKPIPPSAKSPHNPDSDDTYYGELQFDDQSNELLRASDRGFSRWRIDGQLIQLVGNHRIETFGLSNPDHLNLARGLGYLVENDDTLYACRWDEASKSVTKQSLLKFPSTPYSWDNNHQTLVRFEDDKNDRYRLAMLDPSGKLQKILDPQEGWEAATFSSDRSLIATSDYPDVQLLDQAGKEIMQKKCEIESSEPPMFSSDNQRIIYGPSQIDLSNGNVEIVYPFDDIWSCAASPVDPITAYGHSNGRISLFNQISKTFIASLGPMRGGSKSLCFHSSGRYIASLDGYGSLYVWDISTLPKDSSKAVEPTKAVAFPLPTTFESGAIRVTVEGGQQETRASISEALRNALRELQSL